MNNEKLMDNAFAFIEKFINLFVTADTSVQQQQAIKIIIFIAILLLFFGVGNFILSFAKNIIKPLIDNVGKNAEYAFYSIIVILMFVFVQNISFKGAAFVLILMVILSKAELIVKEINKHQEKQKHDNINN